MIPSPDNNDLSLHRMQVADDVTRAMPHAVGPEKSILSSMLQEPQYHIGLAIEEGFTKEFLYLPQHSILFEVLVELFEKGAEIELVSLVQHLLDRGLLDRIGGPGTITELYTYAPSAGHFRHHLGLVREKFILRSLIHAGNEIIASAYDEPDEAQALLDAAERKVLAIRDTNDPEKTQSIKSAVTVTLEILEARIRGESAARGLMTGFDELDRMTNGLHPGDMFVIGARPSMGKTSFMMNIVEQICLGSGHAVQVFSAEMSQQKIVERLVYSRARFAFNKLEMGQSPTKDELQRIRRAATDVAASKLLIDDRGSPSLNHIRSKSRRAKKDHDIQAVAIDYMQLIKSKSRQSEASREREIAEISSGLKALGKELGIPIIVLAQLSRDVEKRQGQGKQAGVPRMSDLRESGSIEQDADYIGLLYRSAYYATTAEEKAAKEGEAALQLAKNRHGETGPIPLTFIADMMRFETGAPVQTEMFPQPRQVSRYD